MLICVIALESLAWGSNQSHEEGLYYDKVMERMLHYVYAKVSADV